MPRKGNRKNLKFSLYFYEFSFKNSRPFLKGKSFEKWFSYGGFLFVSYSETKISLQHKSDYTFSFLAMPIFNNTVLPLRSVKLAEHSWFHTWMEAKQNILKLINWINQINLNESSQSYSSVNYSILAAF